jgi:hypothetical protein
MTKNDSKLKISPTLGLKSTKSFQSHHQRLSTILFGWKQVQICNLSANLNLKSREEKVRFDYGLGQGIFA